MKRLDCGWGWGFVSFRSCLVGRFAVLCLFVIFINGEKFHVMRNYKVFGLLHSTLVVDVSSLLVTYVCRSLGLRFCS